jgi:hypothetical protein
VQKAYPIKPYVKPQEQVLGVFICAEMTLHFGRIVRPWVDFFWQYFVSKLRAIVGQSLRDFKHIRPASFGMKQCAKRVFRTPFILNCLLYEAGKMVNRTLNHETYINILTTAF